MPLEIFGLPVGDLGPVGELLGLSSAASWTLEGQDKGFSEKFVGDLPPMGMEENVGSTLGDTSSIGKAVPAPQWLHGDTEVFTFTARLWARNSFKNVKQQVEVLKSFARKSDELKRAPIFLFSAGTEISFTCFVRGVKFKYDDTLRSDGSIRGAIVDITLQKIEEKIKGDAGTSLASKIKFVAGVVGGAAGIVASVKKLKNIPGGSLHTIDRTILVKQGMTFESIAKQEYGNPLLGDILRRTQPELADLQTGDVVELVDATEIKQMPVTQQAIPLRDTQENINLRATYLAMRGKKTTIFV